MKLKTVFAISALLVSLSAATNVPAGAQTGKHSAAWYRTHRTHSAAWYRTHRAPAAHSAAWYRTHQRHSAAWYRRHRK